MVALTIMRFINTLTVSVTLYTLGTTTLETI
eukprot:COSAG02_NODE_27188_length_615_cov_1.096899_1_plen_31_part_10